jgi:iron complex outermembrane receptor protein
VVTANRRPENLQSVPITAEVITAQTATEFGVTDKQSLANAVPGLTFDRSTATAVPFLRGVGPPVGQVSAEPSVSAYVDDVYTPAAGASLPNFSSLDSLEVLKGPQGTLFGRNAVGGVIEVRTRNPTPTPELDLEGGYATTTLLQPRCMRAAGSVRVLRRTSLFTAGTSNKAGITT